MSRGSVGTAACEKILPSAISWQEGVFLGIPLPQSVSSKLKTRAMLFIIRARFVPWESFFGSRNVTIRFLMLIRDIFVSVCSASVFVN